MALFFPLLEQLTPKWRWWSGELWDFVQKARVEPSVENIWEKGPTHPSVLLGLFPL